MSSISNDGTASDPWDKETKDRFESKPLSQYFDPCEQTAKRSIKCLNRNGGDRSMCHDYFQAYRDCKKAWIEKRKEERRNGGSMT